MESADPDLFNVIIIIICIGMYYHVLSINIYYPDNGFILQQPDDEIKPKIEEDDIKMSVDTNDEDDDVINDQEDEKIEINDSGISIKDESHHQDSDNKESSPIKEEDSKDLGSPEKALSQKSLQVGDYFIKRTG